MTESTREIANAVRQLLVIGALLVIGYCCKDSLRFTVNWLNSVFVCAYLVLPFFAIRPVRRLSRLPRILGFILLSPLLLLSSFELLGTLLLNPVGRAELTLPLQTFQQGSSTLELQRYDYGGSVGMHGLNLEQRRLIVPGLYLVKSIDFFDSAREGTLSVEGPYRVRVQAKGNYDNNDYKVDKAYSLKPWVYF